MDVRTQPETPRAHPSVSAVSGGSKGPVVGRLVADDVDDRCGGAASIVQIGQAVRQARTAVQQRGGRLTGHACVAVSGAGHHAFEQTQYAMHAGNAIERRDKVHFRRAGV